uniref:Uncharacterized protein n=1 Tax=Panagrolaimus sp. ES5 TaxID=591445 RepID=A0AC34GEB6_9BILA
MASYMDASLRQMKFYNMIVARSVGIAANIVLGWLVVKHTNKQLKPYKKVLAITIFCDLNSSILNIMFNE